MRRSRRHAKGRPYPFMQRTIRRFAWLPIATYDEWRWLEMVKVRQIYCLGTWHNIRFAVCGELP